MLMSAMYRKEVVFETEVLGQNPGAVPWDEKCFGLMEHFKHKMLQKHPFWLEIAENLHSED